MKRVIALMVLAAALLPLSACGKSKAVKQTEQLISAIGTVSIQSADAIEAAERALAALTDEEQKTVKNGEVLREARQAYEKLPEKLAFDLSKQAYEKVSEAYDIIELLGEDIYEAWRLGVYESKDVLKKGTELLAKETHLSQEEVADGAIYTMMSSLASEPFHMDNLDEASLQALRETIDASFLLFSGDLLTFCVGAVRDAYRVNGSLDTVDMALEEAKSCMKELSEKYADYEYYPSLKEFYTTANAFYDYCKIPTGSFQQAIDTINDYKNDARKFRNDLDYIFKD